MDSQHPLVKGKLASSANSCAKGLTCWPVPHVRTCVLAHFLSLDNQYFWLNEPYIGVLTTEMTTQRSIMCIIDNPILQPLIMKDNDKRIIHNTCDVEKQAVINGVLI